MVDFAASLAPGSIDRQKVQITCLAAQTALLTKYPLFLGNHKGSVSFPAEVRDQASFSFSALLKQVNVTRLLRD